MEMITGFFRLAQNTMFEGVFHEMDQHQRWDLFAADLLRKVHFNIRFVVKPSLKKIDIILEELDLVLQQHLVMLIFIGYVTQHFR